MDLPEGMNLDYTSFKASKKYKPPNINDLFNPKEKRNN